MIEKQNFKPRRIFTFAVVNADHCSVNVVILDPVVLLWRMIARIKYYSTNTLSQFIFAMNIAVYHGTVCQTEHLCHSEGRMNCYFNRALNLQINKFKKSCVLLLQQTATRGQNKPGTYC